MKTSPSPSPTTKRKVGRSTPKRRPDRSPTHNFRKHQQTPAFTPIAWPEYLTRHKSDRSTIDISSCSEPANSVPFFSVLPFDIRHHIYNIFLQDAGYRQNIFCPSVARRRMPSELHTRHLLSWRCDDEAFENVKACGHFECEFPAGSWKGGRRSFYTLGDLNALMRTCKFAYQEVSVLLYGSVTFIFASLPSLSAFLDWINPSLIPAIRSVAFITHLLPESTDHCMRMIEGEYFKPPATTSASLTAAAEPGNGDPVLTVISGFVSGFSSSLVVDQKHDHIAVFKRIPNLQTLDIRFFPSFLLWYSTKLREMVSPLEEVVLASRAKQKRPTNYEERLNEVEPLKLKIRLPVLYSHATHKRVKEGLPLPKQLDEKSGWYELLRPLAARQEGGGNHPQGKREVWGCRAY